MIKIYNTLGPAEELEYKIKKDFPNANIRKDTELKFYEHLIPKLENQEEIVTVRYDSHGKIRMPFGYNGFLPLIRTHPDNDEEQKIGLIYIPVMFLSTVEDFPEGLAMLDEYNNKPEMIKDLENIYKKIPSQNEFLSAYLIGTIIKQKDD